MADVSRPVSAADVPQVTYAQVAVVVVMSTQVFSSEVIGGLGPCGVAVTVCTAQIDLDLETEPAARRELAHLAAGTGPVVVDVSEVFVAVIGLRLLLEHVEDVRRAGRRVELVMNRHLQRVAHIVGQPEGMLHLSLHDAVARVRSSIPDAAGTNGRASGDPFVPGASTAESSV